MNTRPTIGRTLRRFAGLGAIASSVVVLGACSSSGSGGPSSGPSPDGGSTAPPGNNTCAAAAAGGTTETLPCDIGAALVDGNTTIDITSPDGSDGMSILLELAGAPTAKAYDAATVLSALADFKSADKTKEWQQQAANGADIQGTFSLVITDVGATTDLGAGGTGYQGLHGTFTASFVQVVVASGGTAIDGGAPASLSVKF